MIAVMEDLLTIGDFARRVGLSTSALRFYDDCGLLPPTSVDPATGYRHYAAERIRDAEVVRDCRRLGIPLALVRNILDAPDEAEAVLAEFWEREQEDVVRRTEAFDVLTKKLRGRNRSMATWSLVAEDLRKGIDQVVWAAAKAPAEPEVISSVLIEGGDELRLVATDRYRLAIRDLVPIGLDEGTHANAVVEAAALREIGSSLPDGEAQLRIEDGVLSVSCGDFTADAPALHEGFPDYRRLVSDEHTASALLDAEELAGVLEPLQDSKVTIVEFTELGLQISGHEDPFKVHVAADVTGGSMRVGFNARFLLECLRAGDGPDVLIQGTTPTAPFVIRSATDGSFTTRLMPIRVA